MEHWTVLTGQAMTMPCSSVKDWHPLSDLKGVLNVLQEAAGRTRPRHSIAADVRSGEHRSD
jgi:hypothetical protein